MESRGFEADGSDEGVEIVDDALIEAIELRSPLDPSPSKNAPWRKNTPLQKNTAQKTPATLLSSTFRASFSWGPAIFPAIHRDPIKACTIKNSTSHAEAKKILATEATAIGNSVIRANRP